MYKMNKSTQTDDSLLVDKVKELLEKIKDLGYQLDDQLCEIEKKLRHKEGKMMEGFRCIEKSFRLMAGAIVSMSEDLGSATGTLASDPWAFDA
jgi:hypothetical protein